MLWAVGNCRPLSPRPLNRGESLSQSHLQTPSQQVALRSERCAALSHLPVPLFVNLIGANSHRRFLSLLLTPRENCSSPKATRDHARSVLSMFASGPLLAPTLEDYGVHAGACKTQSCPPQSHSRLAFARPDIANGSSDERSVPPTGQTFHYECFQVLTALDRVPQVTD